ncbi:MAG: GNAT family N-acetyltransferase [Pseudomonadota bacterium]
MSIPEVLDMSSVCPDNKRPEARSAPRFCLADFSQVDKMQWQRLAEFCESPNQFYHPNVLRSAKDTWSRLSEIKFVTAYSGDHLVLLQPVLLTRTILGLVCELVEVPTGDHMEPLVEQRNSEELLKRFAQFIRDDINPEFLLARSLTKRFAGVLTDTLPGTRTKMVPAARGWMLSLPESLDELLRKYSANFRHQIRRRLRKAEAAGLSYRVVASHRGASTKDLHEALIELRRLHGRRFDSLGRQSFFLKPEFEKFHDLLVASPNTGKFNVLFTQVCRGQQQIGSLYGVQQGQRFTFLMIGFEPEFASFSPGHLLIYRTAQALIEDGVTAFDFKCGEESYKSRWSDAAYVKYEVKVERSLRGTCLRVWRSLIKRLGGQK